VSAKTFDAPKNSYLGVNQGLFGFLTTANISQKQTKGLNRSPSGYLIGTGFLTVFMPKPSGLIELEMVFGACAQSSVFSVGLVTTAAREVTTAPWTLGFPPTRSPCPELSKLLMAAALPDKIN
jgi:hypothetical protein